MAPNRNLIIIISPQPQFLILFSLILLIKTNLTNHTIRSAKSSRIPKSASLDVYNVNFILPDELPQNYLVGNIPKKINNFPFLNVLGSSVSATLIDSGSLALKLFRVTDVGDLYTLTAIDRDDPDQLCGPLKCCHLIVCNLTVEVLFIHPGAEAVTVYVHLQIHDENDNDPVFPQQTFSVWIAEDNDLKIGKDSGTDHPSRPLYGLPLATDRDSVPNGVMQYHFRGSYPATSTFHLNSNLSYGKLSLSVYPNIHLDYDGKSQRIFKLTLEAIDGGQPARTGQMLLVIHITDLNDNAPIFKTPKDTIHLPESTPFKDPIYVARATDLDSDDNGLIRYSFGPANPNIPSTILEKFSFHPSTGKLYLRQTLDYETFQERQIDLQFVAHDAGDPPLSSTALLTIYVDDINDNPPQLVVQLNRTIPENSDPGQVALRLLIRDLDEISRDKIHCTPDFDPQIPLKMTMSSDETMLTLITTDTIDYEKTPRLYFGITCVDEGRPKQIQQFNLTVAIKDLNDNAPKFRFNSLSNSNGQYKVLLSEEEPVNKLVLIVAADDADSGSNGQITYSLFDIKRPALSLTSGLSYFTIDNVTGSIFLTKRLDYEQNSVLVFGIKATDNPKPGDGEPQIATAIAKVVILDVNDNGPRLVSPDVMSVVEHMPVGTEVGIVKFDDPDTGPGGEVIIQGIIPEARDRYDDLASDKEVHPFFKLTLDGHLSTLKSIDREKHTSFELKILALDRGLPNPMSTTATVTIKVIDINDNEPVLQYPKPGTIVTHQPIKIKDFDRVPFYELTNRDTILNRKLIFHNSLAKLKSGKMSKSYIFSSVIIQLKALDLDFGENARITFVQNSSCNSSKHFHLDNATGELRARLKLDKLSTKESWESDCFPGLYLVCVLLSDNGKPPLKSQYKFYLKITTPISQPNPHALWPADSAELDSFEGSFKSFYGSNLTWPSNLNTPETGSKIMSASTSNIIIAILLSIFALTLLCTLTAAIFWARSKRRKRQVPQDKQKSSNKPSTNQQKMSSKSPKNDKHSVKLSLNSLVKKSQPMCSNQPSQSTCEDPVTQQSPLVWSERIPNRRQLKFVDNHHSTSSRTLAQNEPECSKALIPCDLILQHGDINMTNYFPISSDIDFNSYISNEPLKTPFITSHKLTSHLYPTTLHSIVSSQKLDLSSYASQSNDGSTTNTLHNTVSHKCPTHGTQLILQPDSNQPRLLTVSPVFESVGTISSSSLPDQSSPTYELRIATISDESASQEDPNPKTVSWIPVPILTEPTEFVCIDGLTAASFTDPSQS